MYHLVERIILAFDRSPRLMVWVDALLVVLIVKTMWRQLMPKGIHRIAEMSDEATKQKLKSIIKTIYPNPIRSIMYLTI